MLPELFKGSNEFKYYDKHLQPVSQLQNWQNLEAVSGAQTKTEERPNYFTLKLQKLAFDINCRLTADTKKP